MKRLLSRFRKSLLLGQVGTESWPLECYFHPGGCHFITKGTEVIQVIPPCLFMLQLYRFYHLQNRSGSRRRKLVR